MKGPDTEYVKNLEHFIQHSDEDEVISDDFLKRFSNIYQRKELRWLDVGAGPGTKLIQILRGLDKTVELNILEPSAEWQRILAQNFKIEGLSSIISRKYQIRWEEFKTSEKYDLITFFHSVYGIGIESLAKIPQYLQENGVACIVVESPNSYLHQIKKGIYPYIHHQELASTSDSISSFLQNRGIHHSVDKQETTQRFYVDDLLDMNNPNRIIPLSFLLQTKPEDHDRLVSQKVQRKIEEELEKYVKFDKKGAYLDIPDRFIWIYN